MQLSTGCIPRKAQNVQENDFVILRDVLNGKRKLVGPITPNGMVSRIFWQWISLIDRNKVYCSDISQRSWRVKP
jgi:hypothetical protein